MDKRDFLRSQGFTVGERGRFNDAMVNAIQEAELNGTLFDEKAIPKKKKVYAFEDIIADIPSQTKLRASRQLKGISKDGNKVEFITCSNCQSHMVYCACDKIYAPSIVIQSDDPTVGIKWQQH
jgi:uncharacterized Ntn-hydrolase superfamily protein